MGRLWFGKNSAGDINGAETRAGAARRVRQKVKFATGRTQKVQKRTLSEGLGDTTQVVIPQRVTRFVSCYCHLRTYSCDPPAGSLLFSTAHCTCCLPRAQFDAAVASTRRAQSLRNDKRNRRCPLGASSSARFRLFCYSRRAFSLLGRRPRRRQECPDVSWCVSHVYARELNHFPRRRTARVVPCTFARDAFAPAAGTVVSVSFQDERTIARRSMLFDDVPCQENQRRS